jgi:hypothetical protein
MQHTEARLFDANSGLVGCLPDDGEKREAAQFLSEQIKVLY